MQPLRTVSASAAGAALLTVVLAATTATPALADPGSGTPAPGPTPVPAPTQPPAPIAGEPWATALSHRSGHSAYSRTLTLTGSGFTDLDEVLVGGVPATGLTVRSDTSATFLMDTAPGFQPGIVSIALVSDDATTIPTSLTFQYKVVNGRDKQMQYAFQHWSDTASARFGYIKDNDCADFTSQTLLARGWKQSAQWFDSGAAAKTKLPIASATWVSSTAMSEWLHERTDLAQHLGYNQADRDEVVVGDIVQFNWNAKKYPGVWLHTAVVSKVVVLPNGHHDISYVAHTNNSQYGGSTQWLAQHWTTPLRIQFWHLKK